MGIEYFCDICGKKINNPYRITMTICHFSESKSIVLYVDKECRNEILKLVKYEDES